MITVKVIFVREPVSEALFNRYRQYTFALETDEEIAIHVGAVLDTDKYDSYLQVCEIIEEQYNYYDPRTGSLSRDAQPWYLPLKLLKVH